MHNVTHERKEKSLLGPYRVLDLTDEKGVLCTKLLADFGADVIKIEPPDGDPMRNIGPFYHDEPDPEKSLFWFTFNTSKRSITLDISQPEGQQLFRELAATVDFIVECFPPGYMESLGLGYSALSELNPRLIVTSITPFGQTGPYRDYKAYDLVGLAMGGLLYLIGEPHRPPVRVRAQQAYAQASVQAATGTITAHYYRQASGEGQHVDVSMQEAVSNTIDTAQQAWDLQQVIYKRVAPFRPLGDYNLRCVYPCKDGYVACWRPEELETIIEWMDSEGVPYDKDQMARWLELRKKIDEGELTLMEAMSQEELTEMQETRIPLLAKLTRQEIYKGALEKDFGWAPVNTPKDLVEYEQLATRNYYVQVEHPELGETITYPGAPCKMTATPWQIWNRAPLIGEHNEEVYVKEMGMSPQRLHELKQAKLI
jgi:benzylsuccinate CoA-transferase BbsE subunit